MILIRCHLKKLLDLSKSLKRSSDCGKKEKKSKSYLHIGLKNPRMKVLVEKVVDIAKGMVVGMTEEEVMEEARRRAVNRETNPQLSVITMTKWVIMLQNVMEKRRKKKLTWCRPKRRLSQYC